MTLPPDTIAMLIRMAEDQMAAGEPAIRSLTIARDAIAAVLPRSIGDVLRDAAQRILALPVPAGDDEAMVERVMGSVRWQMALTDVIEDPTRRDLQKALLLTALAAMREGK